MKWLGCLGIACLSSKFLIDARRVEVRWRDVVVDYSVSVIHDE